MDKNLYYKIKNHNENLNKIYSRIGYITFTDYCFLKGLPTHKPTYEEWERYSIFAHSLHYDCEAWQDKLT